MAAFIAQAESYLADLESHIAKLEEESALKDAEIRRLLMRDAVTAPQLKRESTYVMLKPDAVQRGLVGEICERFEQKGFKLVGMKMVTATKKQLENHYSDLVDKPFFPGLIQYMSMGPVMAMVWEGDNVIKTARVMLGATKPKESEPGTIRGDLCIDVGRNICHASDSPDSALKEIALWFPEGLSGYAHHSESWVFENVLDTPTTAVA
jgi:nucleoside-diphosphate kinase